MGIFGGVCKFIDRRTLIRDCTASTSDIITEVQSQKVNRTRGSGFYMMYRAFIEYKIASSDTPQTMVTEYRRDTFEPGKTVTVMYDPNTPSKVYTTE